MSRNPRDLPEYLPSDEEAAEIATAYLEEKGLMPADAVPCSTEHAQIISTDEDGEVGGGGDVTGIDLGYYEAQAMEDPAYLVPVYIFTGEVVDGNTTTPFVRYVAAAPECRGEVPRVQAAS
ncbi:hypothetical protein J2129_002603 [Methanofollis sp. W23]|uniref:hypothetical protein n=1 Tax=Methanofollis sp. W23 TaxID=2817849 RepID=UPI001AE63610|nr:hypothetical protein [Methanofollis sp. W23]MBP2147149.1 hypothetical protein [Methanofollis sp. W23]